jgi:MFS transporter, DHA2 family, multidrug resistance protein
MRASLSRAISTAAALSDVGRLIPRLRADSLRLYVALLGVLLGAALATLGTRVTSFGLADLRGGVHAGFDEGAWFTTSFGIGQMLMAVAAPYFGATLGVRRVLLHGIGLFFIASLLGPLSPNLAAFLAMGFLAGIGSGTFIPLTVSFILRNMPASVIVYAMAIYALNSELSQNIAASLEGWYADHWSWHWIYWQYCLALPLMYVCIWYGVPRESGTVRSIRDLDWPGLAYAGGGFALLFAALDQGNRLDWTNSGLINGLLLSGALLLVAFAVRGSLAPRPFLNIRLVTSANLLLLLALLAGFRFIILSTSYIIPTYLQTVQNFRELQVGAVLLWIALPQFIIVLPLAALLQRVDPRWVLALGSMLIGTACLMATNLTSQWATDDFLPSQILQAIGQSFALTALLMLIVRSIDFADALTIGSLLQISRLFGGEIGTAFMQTFVRVREQVHSNLIGLHVDGLATQTIDRLATYRGALGARTADLGEAAAQATKLLAANVAQQASVLAYIDGFLAAAAGAFVCLLLVALVRTPRPFPA